MISTTVGNGFWIKVYKLFRIVDSKTVSYLGLNNRCGLEYFSGYINLPIEGPFACFKNQPFIYLDFKEKFFFMGIGDGTWAGNQRSLLDLFKKAFPVERVLLGGENRNDD